MISLGYIQRYKEKYTIMTIANKQKKHGKKRTYLWKHRSQQFSCDSTRKPKHKYIEMISKSNIQISCKLSKNQVMNQQKRMLMQKVSNKEFNCEKLVVQYKRKKNKTHIYIALSFNPSYWRSWISLISITFSLLIHRPPLFSPKVIHIFHFWFFTLPLFKIPSIF